MANQQYQEAMEYERKLAELQAFVPFLHRTIAKLQRSGDRSRDPQVAKMNSLLVILTDKDKRLALDALRRCEEVLQRLHEKVEGEPLLLNTAKRLATSPSSPQRQPSPQQHRPKSGNFCN